MVKNQKLPIGIDSFEKIRANHFYYIDKTGLIASIIQNWGEVNLFTRPRRFGKSLNMSMLKCFFETGCDKSLFDGLKVSEDKELCKKYMGKFPVISTNAKSGQGFGDILIETPGRIGIVIEVKYAERDMLEKGCAQALEQIEKNCYTARLKEDGMKSILKYGIAFYKKHCKVSIG